MVNASHSKVSFLTCEGGRSNDNAVGFSVKRIDIQGF